jgi:hypothetical protein
MSDPVAKRLRELADQVAADHGGRESMSAAQAAIVTQIAKLMTEAERVDDGVSIDQRIRLADAIASLSALLPTIDRPVPTVRLEWIESGQAEEALGLDWPADARTGRRLAACPARAHFG